MNTAAFFNAVRAPIFKGRLTTSQVQGTELILAEAQKRGTPLTYLAYILATTAWETAYTMQPIREIGRGRGRRYGVPTKHGGQIAYGRGYVQLTWDYNYERADRELGLNGALIRNYDLALDPAVAIPILFTGMEEGWFTGRKLSDFGTPGSGVYNYVGARRIINGNDKREEIAAIARHFETALRRGSYRVPVPSTPKPVSQEPVRVSWWDKLKSRFS